MLLQTLKTLIIAGKDALRSTCELPVTDEHITQIRRGHLTFPSLGELGFSGGVLHQIHLGCDAILCSQLAGRVDSSSSESGLKILSNKILKNVLEDLDDRRTRGWVESLDVGPLNLHSSGVRSFGFRMQTEIGQLYMMAEIPSKMELAAANDGDILAPLAATYLPRGWASFSEIKSSSAIDSFLIFLRKTEIDIQVEVPAENKMFSVHTGVLLETVTYEGQRTLRVCLDVSESEGKSLKKGDTVYARVGVQDRAITFATSYLGTGDYPVVGSATIKCVYFSLPAELKVEQRRRAFRIEASERIPVEIEIMVPEAVDLNLSDDEEETAVVRGRLADLSFSGARIIADQNKLMKCVRDNSHVTCRLFFPDERDPLEVMAIIRRATIRLTDRDNQKDEIGLEFLASTGGDRQALEFIRQYVLSQQRSWLADRIHVAGVDQW